MRGVTPEQKTKKQEDSCQGCALRRVKLPDPAGVEAMAARIHLPWGF